MVTDESRVGPLIKALEDEGFIVGGTQNSVSMISHTQGWLHCDIPGTDASGVVKSMMDELIEEFFNYIEFINYEGLEDAFKFIKSIYLMSTYIINFNLF